MKGNLVLKVERRETKSLSFLQRNLRKKETSIIFQVTYLIFLQNLIDG